MTNEKLTLTLEMIKHRERIEEIKQRIYQEIIDKEIYYIHLAINEIVKELNDLYNLKK